MGDRWGYCFNLKEKLVVKISYSKKFLSYVSLDKFSLGLFSIWPKLLAVMCQTTYRVHRGNFARIRQRITWA